MTEDNRKISEYINALKDAGLLVSVSGADPEARIASVSFDSREAGPGTLFICKGLNFKAEYALSAREKGAECFVCEKAPAEGLPCLIVSDVRRAMAVCSWVWCGKSFLDFPLIGLTGTKGKSTTLYYVKAVCEAWCAKNGLGPFGYISTIDTFDGKVLYESHLTTPEAPELAQRFRNAKEAGVFAMGMEVSSQALKYDRCFGLRFSLGAFLNFGSDHIGDLEHATIEDYLQSKLKIFSCSDRAMIDLDTERVEDVLKAAEDAAPAGGLIFYSPLGNDQVMGRKANYAARNIRKESGMTVFEVWGRASQDAPLSFITEIRLTMPGLFNAENALAAFVICSQLGIPAEEIRNALLNARAAGRMELYEDKERDVTVIVDYAHNELSYEKLFGSCKSEYPGRRIEIVFGCPGGKGLSRRVELPRVTAKYADYAWITEEDPFMDDPMEISKEVLSNLQSFGGHGEIIVDREACIRTAIEKAAPGTVIILAAKGRELYQHRGNEYVKIVSDAELAAKLTGNDFR